MCTAATDNAYAEKLNDVIKNEYLRHRPAQSPEQLRRILQRSVQTYNHTRHHGQLPRRSSPAAYEAWLQSRPAGTEHYALLIRDGQANHSGKDPQPTTRPGGPNLAYPAAWATKGVSQILPAHLILDHPTANHQLSLNLW